MASSHELLLRCAFGRDMLEAHGEWRGVPEVLRSSFLLLAKEIRHLLARTERLEAAVVMNSSVESDQQASEQLKNTVIEVKPTSWCQMEDRVAAVETAITEFKQLEQRRQGWLRDALGVRR